MSRNRWCDGLGLGAGSTCVARLAVPLTGEGQQVAASLGLDRVAASGEALQSLGTLEVSRVLGGSARRWVAGVTDVALPSTWVLLVGGALLAVAVVGWWLLRRRGRRRADLADELARLNDEIRAAEEAAASGGAEPAGEAPTDALPGLPAEARRASRPAPAAVETVVTPDEVQPGGHSVARLEARVTTLDGEPAAGVRLRMVADGGPVGRVFADRTTVTDRDGRTSLEVRVPLIAEGRRLYFTAEVIGVGEGADSPRARTWVRVRDVALEVRPDRPRVQRGADGGTRLLALLRDDAGEPVKGVELRSEVVDAGGGPLTPETAATDAGGRAEFLYSAGDRVGEVRVRIWPEGEPQLTREIVVEQVE